MFLTCRVLLGFRGRGGGGGGPNFDIKGGDWPCPNRFVSVFYAFCKIQQKELNGPLNNTFLFDSCAQLLW